MTNRPRHYKAKKRWLPKKGTKTRAVLLCLLREQGLTAREALDLGIIKYAKELQSHMSKFRDMGGWEFCKLDDKLIESHYYGRYRAVARLRLDGEWRKLF